MGTTRPVQAALPFYQDPLVILHSYIVTKPSSQGLLPVSTRKFYLKVRWLFCGQAPCVFRSIAQIEDPGHQGELRDRRGRSS